MGWVEELKPEDEVKVEIIYPPAYAEAYISTIRKYARGIACLCKGAATLGQYETEFLVWDMLIVQVITIEETMRQFGIEMTHECGKLSDGRRWTYFYADLTELKERMENGEFDEKMDM